MQHSQNSFAVPPKARLFGQTSTEITPIRFITIGLIFQYNLIKSGSTIFNDLDWNLEKCKTWHPIFDEMPLSGFSELQMPNYSDLWICIGLENIFVPNSSAITNPIPVAPKTGRRTVILEMSSREYVFSIGTDWLFKLTKKRSAWHMIVPLYGRHQHR